MKKLLYYIYRYICLSSNFHSKMIIFQIKNLDNKHPSESIHRKRSAPVATDARFRRRRHFGPRIFLQFVFGEKRTSSQAIRPREDRYDHLYRRYGQRNGCPGGQVGHILRLPALRQGTTYRPLIYVPTSVRPSLSVCVTKCVSGLIID